MRWALVVAVTGCGRIAFDPLDNSVDPEIVSLQGIAAGGETSCVRREDGSVWCWGAGESGQLGNGVEPSRATAARVMNLPAVIAIDAGLTHVCALEEQGSVWCWGAADYSQVDGTPQSFATPKRVPLSRPAISVTAGGYHTCAILDDSSLTCWGKSDRGQLGNGVIGSEGLFEGILDQVTAVSAGQAHTCAVRAGIVWCWGSNDSQQLGNGSDVATAAPSPTPGIQASSLAAGSDHTCALDGGRYRCWGSNQDGQLGATTGSAMPTPPSSLQDLVALRAGYVHTCAIRSDATAWCWGNNTLGGLGDGTGTGLDQRVVTPTQVSSGPVADVATGEQHTCATRRDGGVSCWGVGRLGQVGDPALMASTRPRVVPLPGTPLAITAGARFACAVVDPQGALYCWGQNNTAQLGLPSNGAVATPTDTTHRQVSGVTLGESHGCAVIAGTLRCWGANDRGQLGNGSMTSSPVPVPVDRNLTQVGAGRDFTCGSDGVDAWCWGANDSGKLGVVGGDQPSPVLVQSGEKVTAGGNHACTVSGSTVACWGDNADGQVGNGMFTATELPTPVSGGLQLQTITAGAVHTCASRMGDLYCWGFEGYGNLGVGGGNNSNTPVLVTAGDASEVTAGWHHTCANIAGTSVCWGRNRWGQIGDGTVEYARSLPTPIVDLPGGALSFAAGEDFTCAHRADGQVACWGDNTYGQLGLGAVGFAASPSPVALP